MGGTVAYNQYNYGLEYVMNPDGYVKRRLIECKDNQTSVSSCEIVIKMCCMIHNCPPFDSGLTVSYDYEQKPLFAFVTPSISAKYWLVNSFLK